MTLTVRSATVTGATTKGSALTHAEMDANWAHVIQSSNHSFLQSGTAFATSVQNYLRLKKIVLGWIPPAQWAGIAAGTDTTDLTTYIAQALTDCAGAKLYFPAGTYYCNVTQLPSNTHIFGDGEATVIRAKTTTTSTLKCLSADDTTFITGVTIRDLKLFGTVATESFNANPALIDFTGVKRCRIDGVFFEGFRLDGIYLGGNVGAAEYHNVDVIVKDCVFDGVNNGGRNGISVIDVDGLEIEGCVFRNCAKSDQPGSLDFEPNQSFSVIKNVRVMNNSFYNTDGNRGHVCIQTHNTANVENIIVKGNHFEDVPVASAAVLLNTSTTAPATPQRIVIEGNTIDCSGSRGIYKRDGAGDGITIKGNIISALTGVWLAGTATTTRNVVIEGNIIYDEATSSGIVLSAETSFADIAIKGNTFKGTPTNHIHIAGTASSGISIVDNDFIGTPATRVITHDSVTPNAATNVLLGNRFELGALSTFLATRTDYVGSTTNPTDADETTLPNAYPRGINRIFLNNRTVAGATQAGMLETHVESSIEPQAIYQWFVPDYIATYKNRIYFRRAVNATTWDSWSVLAGTPGTSVTTTAVGNVGSGTDNLMTYSLPAATLSAAGKGVRITAWGTTANNANPKTVTLAFGATTLITTALTVSQAGVWRIVSEVFSTGTDAQQYVAQLNQGGATTLVDVEQGTAAIDDGAAITIKCTGTVTDGGGGINNDDIVQEGMIVEHIL